jgi:ABC-type lipoprotein release transport system permease subunit
MIQLFKMAFRDLGRNRRRSILSALAVSIGVALLLFMASTIAGEMRGAMQNTIKLQSGDLQIRAKSYDENKISLKWDDLIENPDKVIEQLNNVPQVVTASPRLFASGIVTLGENSRGVSVIGIDPDSPTSQPFREGVIDGNFLTSDDREGILIGKPLAEKFGLKVGDNVNLLVNTSNGDVDEQSFVVRGIFTTNTTGYDESTVFMPLVKAQAITGTQDHASTIFIILKDSQQADAVAAAIQSSSFQVLTWQKMNELITQTQDFANAFMVVFYLIVLAITATVVTNTLVMAVFERTREIGILAAIGMKGRRIMAMFLAEATLLATAGVVFGLILGVALTLYFNRYGIYIGDMGVTGYLMEDRIYAYLNLKDAINLTIIAYVITLIASLYPARIAARMEPVEALHGN